MVMSLYLSIISKPMYLYNRPAPTPQHLFCTVFSIYINTICIHIHFPYSNNKMLLCSRLNFALPLVFYATLAAATFIVNLSPTSARGASTVGAFFRKHPALFRHVGQVYSFGPFAGFSGNFNVKLVRALQMNPLVHSVVPDVRVTTTQYGLQNVGDGVNEVSANGLGVRRKLFEKHQVRRGPVGSLALSSMIQYDAPRHLARIQQRRRLGHVGEFLLLLSIFFNLVFTD